MDYFTEQLGPRLAPYAPLHREIWGLEQAMLNIACFYANPAEPFREVGSAFNSRADYAYFNQHYAGSGYRIAPPRVINPPSAILSDGPFRLNGVGGQPRVLHYVWKPKPWGPKMSSSRRSGVPWPTARATGRRVPATARTLWHAQSSERGTTCEECRATKARRTRQ